VPEEIREAAESPDQTQDASEEDLCKLREVWAQQTEREERIEDHPGYAPDPGFYDEAEG
jgi:hypothetical protein